MTVSRESSNFHRQAIKCQLIHMSQSTLPTVDHVLIEMSIDCQFSISRVLIELLIKVRSRVSINNRPWIPSVHMIRPHRHLHPCYHWNFVIQSPCKCQLSINFIHLSFWVIKSSSCFVYCVRYEIVELCTPGLA